MVTVNTQTSDVQFYQDLGFVTPSGKPVDAFDGSSTLASWADDSLGLNRAVPGFIDLLAPVANPFPSYSALTGVAPSKNIDGSSPEIDGLNSASPGYTAPDESPQIGGLTLAQVVANLGNTSEETMKKLMDKMSPELANAVQATIASNNGQFQSSLFGSFEHILDLTEERIDELSSAMQEPVAFTSYQGSNSRISGGELNGEGLKHSSESLDYQRKLSGAMDAFESMPPEGKHEFRASVNYLVAMVGLIAILQQLRLLMLAVDSAGIKTQMDAEKNNMKAQTSLVMERVNKQKIMREKAAKAQAMANDPLMKMAQIYMAVVMAIIAIVMSVLTVGTATPVAVAMLTITITAIVISTFLTVLETAGVKVYGDDEEKSKTTRMVVNIVLLIAALTAAFGSATAAAAKTAQMTLQASMKVGLKAMGGVALQVAPTFIMNSNILFEAAFAIAKSAGASEEDAAIIAAIINIIIMIVMMLAMMKFTPKMDVASWTKGSSSVDDLAGTAGQMSRAADDAPTGAQTRVSGQQTVTQQTQNTRTATASLDDAASMDEALDSADLTEVLGQLNTRLANKLDDFSSRLDDLALQAESADDLAALDDITQLRGRLDQFRGAGRIDSDNFRTISQQLDELDNMQFESLDDISQGMGKLERPPETTVTATTQATSQQVDEAIQGADDGARSADDAVGAADDVARTEPQKMSFMDKLKSMNGDDLQEMVQMMATYMAAMASLMQGISHLQQGFLKREVRDLQWETDLMDIGMELMRGMIPSFQRARENLQQQIEDDAKFITSFHNVLQQAFQEASKASTDRWSALRS